MSGGSTPAGSSSTRDRVAIRLEEPTRVWRVAPARSGRDLRRGGAPRAERPEDPVDAGRLGSSEETDRLADLDEAPAPLGEPDGVPEPAGDPDEAPAPLGEPDEAPAPPAAAVLPPFRPVVAVIGLGPRCGTSTVARWLAAALAVHDPEGSAVVAGRAPRGTGALRTPSAARLARALEARSIGAVRAAGRLCLVDSGAHPPLAVAATYLAPLVVDLAHGTLPTGALSVADHVLLVASPAVEPALAAVVAGSVARGGPEPVIVLNRALEDRRWEQRADVVLAESRLAARRASAGREARGPVGAAVSRLAATLEGSWD